MKKQLLVLAAMVAAVSAMAQGSLNFANQSTSLILKQTTGPGVTANVAAADLGRMMFAWAPQGSAMTAYTGGSLSGWLAANPAVTLLPDVANIGVPVAGRFSGGSKTLNTPVAGGTIQAVLIGWMGGSTAFTSFDAALTSGDISVRLGVSPIFLVDTANPNALPSPETPVNLTTFTGMTLMPIIPEPTSFALLGLGAAGLLIFRRRS